MRYYGRLASRLRQRGMPEPGIARVLSEVRDLSTASAKAPQEEFGPADAYAETFSKGGARWPLSRWVNWIARLTGYGFVILNVELRQRAGQLLLPVPAPRGPAGRTRPNTHRKRTPPSSSATTVLWPSTSGSGT